MTPPASTDWKETIADDEPARLERLAETLRDLQGKRARGGAVSRGLHAKANAGLLGELTVRDDVPAPLRVGIFAAPGSYRTYVRYSNGAGKRQRDGVGDVRGIAFKILGVPGKKLIPGLEDATTQDFLLIRAPTMPFKTADQFVTLIRAAETPALLLFKLIGGLGLGTTLRTLPVLARGLNAPMQPLAATRYWSVLPMQWGAYAAKVTLVPEDAPLTPVPKRKEPEALGAELAARLRQGPVHYTFGAQLFVDETKTPIEDPTVEWLESDAPVVPLARLTLASQDLSAPAAVRAAAYIETLSFDPWHAPVEFRPLGQMMRARNAAYRLSTQLRGAAKEPDGTERFDESAA